MGIPCGDEHMPTESDAQPPPLTDGVAGLVFGRAQHPAVLIHKLTGGQIHPRLGEEFRIIPVGDEADVLGILGFRSGNAGGLCHPAHLILRIFPEREYQTGQGFLGQLPQHIALIL